MAMAEGSRSQGNHSIKLSAVQKMPCAWHLTFLQHKHILEVNTRLLFPVAGIVLFYLQARVF